MDYNNSDVLYLYNTDWGTHVPCVDHWGDPRPTPASNEPYWVESWEPSYPMTGGTTTVSSNPKEERRDKMISKRVFNEALAEEGVSKGDRRKVERLSDADFDYLIATLLAKAFDPEMLKVFEPDVQKVKVVEE